VWIFKNKPFARFARKARLSDATLCRTISDAMRGLVDAGLGGGKSGGFRVVILFRSGTLAFFVHGFVKSERHNIDDDEPG
jgi:hypothetical protein